MKITVLAAAVLLLATTTHGALAASPEASGQPTVVADLEGRAIEPAQIPNFYCHDRDFPVIHCYATALKLEAAVVSSSGLTAAASPSDYVVVYAGTSYSTSYMFISQNYDVLALVGWNDRIRSYRALNGYSGRFFTNWYGSGTVLDFCCNQTAPYLSGTFDSQISSVYRR